jgi:hypothetical protein
MPLVDASEIEPRALDNVPEAEAAVAVGISPNAKRPRASNII